MKTKIRKFGAWLMAMSLAFAGAGAYGAVAEVFDNEMESVGTFDTLAAAVAAAQDDYTVRLYQDVDLGNTSITVDEDEKSITIDLNGRTVTGNTKLFVQKGKYYTYSPTVFTLTGGGVVSGVNNVIYGDPTREYTSMRLVLAGVEVRASNGTAIRMGAEILSEIQVEDDTVNVVSAQGDAGWGIYFEDDDYYVDSASIWGNGTLRVDGSKYGVVFNYCYVPYLDTVEAYIRGGTSDIICASTQDHNEIYAGHYTRKVDSAYLARACACLDDPGNADYPYVVAEAEKVWASFGGKAVITETLAEAIAQAGTTPAEILVCGDLEGPIAIAAGQSITLDAFDGCTVDGAITAPAGTLTIVGGSYTADPTAWLDYGLTASADAGVYTVVTRQLEPDGQGVFHIVTLDDLAAFRNMVNDGEDFAGQTVSLDANIDMSPIAAWKPIGTSSNFFAGRFEGNNKKLSGMTVVGDASIVGGFFATLDAGSTVRKLWFENATVSGTYAAVLAYQTGPGSVIDGVIVKEGCTVTGSSYACGIVALYAYGDICNCWNYATVSGNIASGIAGFVGSTSYDKVYVTNCVNKGDVTGTARASGIAAKTTNADVSWCCNVGAIKRTVDYGGNSAPAAGIVAVHAGYSRISYCLNTGAITASGTDNINASAAGIAGHSMDNQISIAYCDNRGDITAEAYALGIGYGLHSSLSIASCRNGGALKSNTSTASGMGVDGFNVQTTTEKCLSAGEIDGVKTVRFSAHNTGGYYYDGETLYSAAGAPAAVADALADLNDDGNELDFWKLDENGKIITILTVPADPKPPVARIVSTGEDFATLAAAIAAAGELSKAAEETVVVQFYPLTIEEGAIKLPDYLKNVKLVGAADKATTIKNGKIMASDGGPWHYENVTVEGIVFDNANVVLTGWRVGGPCVAKGWTFRGNDFLNIVNTESNAAIHFNTDAHEPVVDLVVTGNRIDGVTGSSNNGICAVSASGKFIVTDNVIARCAWRSMNVGFVTADGIAEEIVIEDNALFDNVTSGFQFYPVEDAQVDPASIAFRYNVVDECYEKLKLVVNGFDLDKTELALDHNYFNRKPADSPDRFYVNDYGTTDTIYTFGVYPYYDAYHKEELLAGTMTVRASLYNLVQPAAVLVKPDGKVPVYAQLADALAAAASGDRVKMLVASGAEVVLQAGVTLDPNGLSHGTVKAADGSILKENADGSFSAVVPVAEIGETKFGTLAEAVAAVGTGLETPTEIRMLANETMPGNNGVTIPGGRDIVLDLNGFRICNDASESNYSATIMIEANGKLTVKDTSDGSNGVIINAVAEGTNGDWGSTPRKNWSSNAVSNHGTFVLESGNIVNTTEGISYCVDNLSNVSSCTFVMNGGKLYNNYGDQAVRLCANSGASINQKLENRFEMHGGEIVTGGFWVQMAGAIGGNFDAAKNWATVVVDGGTVNGFVDVGNQGTCDVEIGGNAVINASKMRFRSLGGADKFVRFTGGRISIPEFDDQTGGDYFPAVVSGGVFTETAKTGLSGYVADGYEFVANADSATSADYPWTIGLRPTVTICVSSAGSDAEGDGTAEKPYATFAKAIAEAKSGDTVKLLSGLTENFVLGDRKNLSFDLGGNTLTGSVTVSAGSLVLSGAGTITGAVTGATVADGFLMSKYQQDNTETSSEWDYTTPVVRVLAQDDVAVRVTGEGSEEVYYFKSLGEASRSYVRGGQPYVPSTDKMITITMLKDNHGGGLAFQQKDTTVTVDFGGFTYTVDSDQLAGSAGTTTQAAQILKRITMTFRNGTFVADHPQIKDMIRSYAENMTFDNMVIDGSKMTNPRLTVVCLNGEMHLKNGTKVLASENAPALSAEYYSSYKAGLLYIDDNTVEISGSLTYDRDSGTIATMLATVKHIRPADYPFALVIPEECEWTDYTDGKKFLDFKKVAQITVGDVTTGYYTLEDAVAAVGDGDVTIAILGDKSKLTPPKGWEFKQVGEAWTLVRSPVCQIGDEKYSSLAKAVAAVPAGVQTTITVIADHSIVFQGTCAVEIPADKKVILDLNGKTITGATAETSSTALIVNRGELTVVDSAEKVDGHFVGAIRHGANPTWVDDGSGDYSGSYASSLINNLGELVVNGGHLENVSTGSAAYVVDSNNNAGGANLIVNDGELIAAGNASVRLFGSGEVNGNEATINGGYFQATYYGLRIQTVKAPAHVVVNGGEFHATDKTYNCGICVTGDTTAATVVDVFGGRFNSRISGKKAKLSLMGGLYAYDQYVDAPAAAELLQSFVAEGYILVGNTDPETLALGYKWTVVVQQQVPSTEGAETKTEGEEGIPEEKKPEMQGKVDEQTGNVKETLASPEITKFTETNVEKPLFKGDGSLEPTAKTALCGAVDQMPGLEPDERAAVKAAIGDSSNSNSVGAVKIDLKEMTVGVQVDTGSDNVIATLNKVSYDVRPVLVTEVTITKEGGETKTETVATDITKEMLGGKRVSFRLAVGKEFSQTAHVEHWNKDRTAKLEDYYTDVLGDGENKYVQLASGEFSPFDVMDANAVQLVCEVDGNKYASIDAAIAASVDAFATTISLLSDIDPEVEVNGLGLRVIRTNGKAFDLSKVKIAEDGFQAVADKSGDVYVAKEKLDVKVGETDNGMPIRGCTAFPVGMTDKDAQAAYLAAKDEEGNGSYRWQNYVLFGNEGMATAPKLIPQIVGADEGSSVVTIRARNGYTLNKPTRSGVGVKFQLMRSDASASTGFVLVGEPQDEPVFQVDVKEIGPKTYWKIQTIFETPENLQ